MTETEHEAEVVGPGFHDITTDVHGDFQYTLRQFLLMRRLHQGGEWTEVVKDVAREIGGREEWDIDARATYRDFTTWYTSGAAGSGPTEDRESSVDTGSDS